MEILIPESSYIRDLLQISKFRSIFQMLSSNWEEIWSKIKWNDVMGIENSWDWEIQWAILPNNWVMDQGPFPS
jgi:hypothetical protein